METRFWRVWEIHSKVIRLFDGYWIWLRVSDKISKPISGKYLFFSEDKDKLLRIATTEIEENGFEMAKVNENLLEGQTEHVLCLYYEDDSRKHELAERNQQEYKVKYRYWKSDADTLKGKYSKEFLDKLPESKQRHFTSQKTLIESKDKKGKTILRRKLRRKMQKKKA